MVSKSVNLVVKKSIQNHKASETSLTHAKAQDQNDNVQHAGADTSVVIRGSFEAHSWLLVKEQPVQNGEAAHETNQDFRCA